MIFSSRTTARTSRLAALLFGAAVAAAGAAEPAEAREWPAPRGHLSDFAGIVDAASADSIQALAVELKEKTGAELAVVTIQDLGGESIDPAAVDLFQQWGIGGKGKDDGVLIVLALGERRVKIEVGYGLEGILPDGRCGSIIRLVMGPDLRADRFGAGLQRGAEAVANVIAQDRGVALERRGRGIAPAGPGGGSQKQHLIVFLVFAILVPILIVSRIARARRSGRWGDWRSGRRRNWYDPWGGFGGGLGGMGGFGGLGGGGGGRGGGFGGFGGGRSGGGGASGGF